jgi:hypothetical protein
MGILMASAYTEKDERRHVQIKHNTLAHMQIDINLGVRRAALFHHHEQL